MRVLEEKFGTPHPALEGFKEPPAQLSWLVDAFFRLHRRRQHHQNGYQPIAFQDMADFATRVLRLPEDLHSLFFRTIEETDNAVLFDHYRKVNEDLESAKKNRGSKSPKKPRR